VIGRKRAPREGKQLAQEVRKLFAVERTERTRCGGVGARRASEPQIDPARVERGERVKRLGHTQRRMVRQHDAPDPTRRRLVFEAMCSIRILGDELAMLAMP
jgi:hypothetical protein